MARTAELSGNSSTEREGSRQGRSSILITMAAAVLVIVLPSLEAKATCQDLLNNDTYRCRVKADDDDRFTDCFRFTSPGTQSENFDLFSDLFDS